MPMGGTRLLVIDWFNIGLVLLRKKNLNLMAKNALSLMRWVTVVIIPPIYNVLTQLYLIVVLLVQQLILVEMESVVPVRHVFHVHQTVHAPPKNIVVMISVKRGKIVKIVM